MFRRLIQGMVRWALDTQKENQLGDMPELVVSEKEGLRHAHPDLHLGMYVAIGGKVLEFRVYDKKRDEWQTRLYVLHENEDFTQRLAEIISLEMLRS